MTPTITTFAWVPKFARGQVRDLRARWAFEEIGERYTVDLIRDAKTPEYRRLQPFGQVPIYRDDGVALFESGAIVLHIARRGAGLLPDDAAGRAIAEQWVIAALNSVEPAVMDLVRCDLFEADKPWSAQRRPSVLETARARLGGVAMALGDQPYLGGDAFTVGDLMMAAVLRIGPTDELFEGLPTLAAYLARCTARPAFERALADQLAVYAEQAVPAV
ncbi:glutathione S-transferase family protein [Sphingomonas sp. AAP5]|uniref:glutathione S-transferase family protein n=1 Tax=Sphingomonas sp. AAP5 TaxID=1523415 RepID=UPI001056FB5C|nr:glutathione S-transferase family protein [Sphingomonas sp. AAP5]QBM77519.1 glutathione S-transferase family protein [Sphingomonas sp. AAP5]